MKPSEFLFDFGRPVAYYPGLVKYLGSVNAVLFFCQIYYWKDRAQSELGVYKTQSDIQEETGMTRYEQETARRVLIQKGVLIETHKRLEHRIYYRIDEDRLNELLEGGPVKSARVATKAKAGKASPRMRKTTIREGEKVTSGAAGTQQPPNVEIQHSGAGKSRTRLYTEITTQTTAEITHTTDATAPGGEATGTAKSSEAFEVAYAAYPARPGNSKPAALKAWNARIAAGATEQALLDGTKAYAAYCAAMKTEPRYVKLASTFFGVGDHYAANWSVANKPAPHQPSLLDSSGEDMWAKDGWN